MSDMNPQLFLVTFEEGYSAANDPFVLGHPATDQALPAQGINRYLVAGAVYDEFIDKALWRVRPNAMQRLLKELLKKYDVYGFQGMGDLQRLPISWTDKIVYSRKKSTERVLGGKTYKQAQDRYLVKLDTSVLEDFGAPSLGDAWFQCLFVAAVGSEVVTDRFFELAESLGELPRHNHLIVPTALGLFEAMVCYSYPEHPKDVDGPQLVVYSVRSWRTLLTRLFRPVDGQTCLYVDLGQGSPATTYALDFYPTIMFTQKAVRPEQVIDVEAELHDEQAAPAGKDGGRDLVLVFKALVDAAARTGNALREATAFVLLVSELVKANKKLTVQERGKDVVLQVSDPSDKRRAN